MSDFDFVQQLNKLQRQVDGLVMPEVGRWMDWTPTVSQSAAIAITITEARHIVIQGVVRLIATISLTSAGTAANAVVVGGLPVAIGGSVANNKNLGHVLYVDSGSQFYIGVVVPGTTTTTFRFQTHGGANFFGVNPAITIANGDTISFQICYEK